MLRLPEAWVWDLWFAQDGADYHVFFLQASRALLDPERRHLRASIGHAVSRDLRSWTRLPDALVAGDPGAIDDVATWTGSVTRGPDGRWHLFYTALSRQGTGFRQQVAVAESDDLITWHRRQVNPVATADGRWYALLGQSSWADEHWRDPWVFADPRGEGWHLLVTARANVGPEDDRGVIGHARSDDLVTWRIEPPLSAPGSGFGHLEVPQVEVVDGRPVLVFSCLRAEFAAAKRLTPGSGGTWAVAVDSLTGPFDVSAAVALTDAGLYSGRLIRSPDGGWSLVAFHHHRQDGSFVGELGDPLPVAWDEDRLDGRGQPCLVVRA